MNTRIFPALLIAVALPASLIANSDTDRKIADTAKASYNYKTVLEDHVSVQVDDGVVTLTGVVEDKDDKALAEDTVNNLPGVTGVKNEIVVKGDYPEHSDAWTAFKIRGLLLVKANVSATATTIDVHGGVVTLGGTADNEAQKELTTLYAKEVDGVKSVKNDMVVKSQPALGETMSDKIDDASITTQVKFALLTNKATSAFNTKVTTKNGVVKISGDAASDAEKSLVSKVVQDVRGVKSVTNEMTVKI